MRRTQRGFSTSERSFQAGVEEFARLTGWLVFHTYDARRSAAGFPDLLMLRGSRVVVAELKSTKGRLRPEQQVWLDAFQLIPGVEAYVWREPAAWAEIREVLR